MTMKTRRTYTNEEIRSHKEAVTKADAYNAGYRRGVTGEAKGGRWQYRPEFDLGYADGETRACNRGGNS